MITKQVSYATITATANALNLPLQYLDEGNLYDLYLEVGAILLNAVIYKSGAPIGTNDASNKADFEANYKPALDATAFPYNIKTSSKIRKLVIDEDALSMLTNILTQLGGSVGTPIVFTELLDLGGKRHKKRATVTNGKRVQLLQSQKPSASTWRLKQWNGSGQGKGYYELWVHDDTAKIETLRDPFDSATGWTKSGKVSSVVADTLLKIQGAASLAVSLTFSSGGIQNSEKITKSLTAQDWSAVQFVGFSVYGDPANQNVTVGLKVYQGSNSYVFADQAITPSAWTELHFDLSEISTFDLTAVDKIDILFFENIDYKADVVIHVDYLQTMTGIIMSQVDNFFTDAWKPYCQPFPDNSAITITGANKLVTIYVTNLDSGVFDYEVGFGGEST